MAWRHSTQFHLLAHPFRKVIHANYRPIGSRFGSGYSEPAISNHSASVSVIPGVWEFEIFLWQFRRYRQLGYMEKFGRELSYLAFVLQVASTQLLQFLLRLMFSPLLPLFFRLPPPSCFSPPSG
ncbi:hypothetical protein AVEN_49324-1 [Araneus ventricosus]|uniref:Uncharacterized protein n=1 Tax=Araneus ventricosus TaxID=182803 RepID=A0A4Y2UEV0_ARAVE|nr:hypothetical protein AVEN_49324-1 [Araneus ventricosus]